MEKVVRRSIVYDPFPSQEKFHSLESRFKGFSGPVGSGKSAALAQEAIRLAYINPGRLGLVGAPTYPMLRDVTQRALFEVLETNDIPYRFLKQENSMVLHDVGSQVIFRSLDHPERLVGTNLAWFGVDELTYSKEDAWRRLEARLRDPKAQHLCGFAVWTPKGFEWVYKRFISPDERVKGYDAVFAKPGENKHLPPDFYDRLKHSYDERFYKQEVLGEYLNIFSGQVYYAFDRKVHCKPVEFDKRHPIFWAMDFNIDPMASVIGQMINGEIRILEEQILWNSNTLASCEEFEEKALKYQKLLTGDSYGVHPLQITCYGDPAGEQRRSSADKTDWRIVKQWASRNSDRFKVTFKVDSAHPTQKARVAAMNGMLRNHAGEHRMFVHPSCKELIKDLEEVAWKQGASTQIDKDADKKRTHASDALGYLVEKEFGLRVKGGERREYLGL